MNRELAMTDTTCLGCGCLCDDIALRVDGGRVVEARGACERGQAWFLADHAPGGRPEAAAEGQGVAPAVAIVRAVQLLAAARAPLITGLSGTTVEAQRVAVALADRIGAAIDPIHAGAAAPAIAAVQRVGRVGGTLGEVKNRADLVVFWGVDPLATHPRHLERYSVDPPGRFVPDGRAGRTVLVVETGAPNSTAARADDVLSIPADRQFEALWTLRALVRNTDTPQSDRLARPDSPAGLPLDQLRGWADRLRRARYGAVFYDGASLGDAATVEALLLLVRDLNDRARFLALPLGGPGNPAGAEAVLTWQTGFPHAVDFSDRAPRYRPGDATADSRLARGTVDAALLVGPGATEGLSGAALDHLARISTVRIGPDATSPDHPPATVALATATPGIHAPGTVVRVDGAWLPLRPPLSSPWPTDRDRLDAILRQLDAKGEA